MSKVSVLSFSYFSNENCRYVFLDGNTCDSLEKCYNTLQQQLSIPPYFGKNLDALEEVLADLDWITEEKIKVIVLNPAMLLSSNKDKKDVFLEILESSAGSKLQVIYLKSEAAE